MCLTNAYLGVIFRCTTISKHSWKAKMDLFLAYFLSNESMYIFFLPKSSFNVWEISKCDYGSKVEFWRLFQRDITLTIYKHTWNLGKFSRFQFIKTCKHFLLLCPDNIRMLFKSHGTAPERWHKGVSLSNWSMKMVYKWIWLTTREMRKHL